MDKYRKAAALASMIALSGTDVQAQETTDWRAQFAGLDGVSISCMRTIKRKYAARVCKKLMEHAATRLSDMDVPHEVMGTAYDRGYRPGPSKTFKTPLNLTIHVRATKPGPLGMDIRISASVTYTAATQDGGAARQGELLMWQNGLTAATDGSTKKLERAAVPVAQKRMGEFLEFIKADWAR